MLSIKEYIYLAIIALIGGALLYEHFHSEAVQAAKDKAADQRVADAQILNNQKVEDLVQLRIQQIQSDNLGVTVTPTTKLVCVAPKASSNRVPQASEPTSGVVAGSKPSSEASEGFDPAPAVLKDGSDTEALVLKLQAYIRALQETGVIQK